MLSVSVKAERRLSDSAGSRALSRRKLVRSLTNHHAVQHIKITLICLKSQTEGWVTHHREGGGRGGENPSALHSVAQQWGERYPR